MAERIIGPWRSDDVDGIWVFTGPNKGFHMTFIGDEVEMGEFGDGPPYLIVKGPYGGLPPMQVNDGDTKDGGSQSPL